MAANRLLSPLSVSTIFVSTTGRFNFFAFSAPETSYTPKLSVILATIRSTAVPSDINGE